MASPSRPRKPSAQIESIIINNTLDEMDQWIPQTIVKGSWVLLQSRRRKRRSKNEFLNSWKGRVKDFKLAENKKSVKEVLIQHVYMHREIQVHEWPEHLPLHRSNCKFTRNEISYFVYFGLYSYHTLALQMCTLHHMKNGSLWSVF